MHMYRIKLYNKIAPAGTDMFDRDVYQCGDCVDEPDGILVRSALLPLDCIPKSVKCIARAGAGVNNIPVAECSERGIVVFNTPGANANAVKELALCALFLSSRNIVEAACWAKTLSGPNGDITALIEKEKNRFVGPEIEGKRLGVIGLGAIGVMVANASHSLGMDVFGYDPYISVSAAWGLSRSVKRARSLRELFETCDYLSLHVPLTEETRNMINTDSLMHMKQGVRILNFSRGELVSSPDIAEALACGAVSCYATDFPDAELLPLKNVLTIPHLGASTPESEINCATMAVSQMKSYLECGNITNSVNMPDAELSREGKHRLCVINRNIPNIVGQISTFLAVEGINIENMLNRSKKEYAYTMVDTNSPISDGLLSRILKIGGVLYVRVI